MKILILLICLAHAFAIENTNIGYKRLSSKNQDKRVLDIRPYVIGSSCTSSCGILSRGLECKNEICVKKALSSCVNDNSCTGYISCINWCQHQMQKPENGKILCIIEGGGCGDLQSQFCENVAERCLYLPNPLEKWRKCALINRYTNKFDAGQKKCLDLSVKGLLEDCEDTTECYANLQCSIRHGEADKKCRLAEFKTCQTNLDCIQDHICHANQDESYSCKARKSLGEYCRFWNTRSCRDPLAVCYKDSAIIGRCKLLYGSTCEQNEECIDRCVDSICTKDCETFNDCKPHGTCIKRKCSSPGKLGDVCKNISECDPFIPLNCKLDDLGQNGICCPHCSCTFDVQRNTNLVDTVVPGCGGRQINFCGTINKCCPYVLHILEDDSKSFLQGYCNSILPNTPTNWVRQIISGNFVEYLVGFIVPTYAWVVIPVMKTLKCINLNVLADQIGILTPKDIIRDKYMQELLARIHHIKYNAACRTVYILRFCTLPGLFAGLTFSLLSVDALDLTISDIIKDIAKEIGKHLTKIIVDNSLEFLTFLVTIFEGGLANFATQFIQNRISYAKQTINKVFNWFAKKACEENDVIFNTDSLKKDISKEHALTKTFTATNMKLQPDNYEGLTVFQREYLFEDGIILMLNFNETLCKNPKTLNEHPKIIQAIDSLYNIHNSSMPLFRNSLVLEPIDVDAANKIIFLKNCESIMLESSVEYTKLFCRKNPRCYFDNEAKGCRNYNKKQLNEICKIEISSTKINRCFLQDTEEKCESLITSTKEGGQFVLSHRHCKWEVLMGEGRVQNPLTKIMPGYCYYSSITEQMARQRSFSLSSNVNKNSIVERTKFIKLKLKFS